MRWSVSLGRIGGVQVYLHVTFVLTLIWAAWQGALDYGGVIGALFGVGAVGSLFLCVLLHELGHCMWALSRDVAVRHITLLPIGGVATLESLPRKPKDELLIALAGPAVNLGLALLFGGAALLVLAPAGGAPLGARLAQALRYPSVLGLLLYLTVANALLVAFNLLPAFPMDGGRLVRAALAMRLPYMQATQGAAAMGQVVAAGFIVISLFGLSLPEIGLASNLGLALIGVVVFASAVSEGRQMRTHAALQELTVGDAARPALKTVTPAKVITADMTEALFAAQAVTPVVVGRQSRLVGVLVRDDPLPEGVPVAAVMHTAYPVIRRQAPLSDAVEALDRSASDEVLVTDRGNLYGVVGWPEIVRATTAPPRGRRLAAMLRSVGAGQ